MASSQLCEDNVRTAIECCDQRFDEAGYQLGLSVFSALEVCYDNALYKFTFDILTLSA